MKMQFWQGDISWNENPCNKDRSYKRVTEELQMIRGAKVHPAPERDQNIIRADTQQQQCELISLSNELSF